MTTSRLLLLVPAATLVLVTACSSSGGGTHTSPAAKAASAQAISASSGHLVAPDGRSLYVLTADKPGKPACNGSCLTLWPPVLGTGTSGSSAVSTARFATLARGSGTQVTYAGYPLYEYSGDKAAGDTNGNGIKAFGGVWELAPASGTVARVQPSAAATSSGRGGYSYP